VEGDGGISSEVVRLTPPEVVLPEEWRTNGRAQTLLSRNNPPLCNFRPQHDFDHVLSSRLLCEQYGAENLSGFGVANMPLAVRAAGALLKYIRENQKEKIEHLQPLRPYFTGDYMVLDENSFRNLELERTIRDNRRKGSLLSVLDNCSSPLGARTLRQWLSYPLLDPERINERLDIVQELYGRNSVRESLREFIKNVGDLQRVVARIALNRCNARDMLALRNALEALRGLSDYLRNGSCEKLHSFAERIDPMPELAAELERAIADDPPLTVREGHMLKRAYNSELDALIELAEHGKDQILAIEAAEKERTGISTLKVRYNRVFGYYIEISKGRADTVPQNYIRKQTLANAERFVTPELKELEDKVLHAEERRNDLEYALFEELRRKVAAMAQRLNRSSEAVGRLDALANFAEIAVTNNYVRPLVNSGDVIDIEQGRHPVVEVLQKDERFVPNDCRLDSGENQLVIITGPNMAGKSTVMRQVALIVLMAQIGSFVPAARAEIGVADRIFTRVGAADNLTRGMSTFMVEMTETANILHNATSKSLIILDEIGRGTSTFDGLSIAWAVAERIHDNIKARTLFATHYHELCELALTKERVRNYNIAVKEWKEQVVFLRKLVPGATNRSYGIQVGRLAGLPAEVVARAREVLTELEKTQLRTSHNRNETYKPKAGPTQLSFFGSYGPPPESEVEKELKSVDIETLTPIEAMNLLYSLKQKLKN